MSRKANYSPLGRSKKSQLLLANERKEYAEKAMKRKHHNQQKYLLEALLE